MADPLYRFNPAAERYIAPSGQFVSRAAVRATLDHVLDASMARVRGVSDALVAGDVELPVWREHVSTALKTAHLQGAAVAAGGWQQLTQDDYEWVGQRVRGQLGYLQRFHDDLASGIAPMDGTVASRAEMYVEQGRATQRAMEARMAQARGVDQEKNVLGGSRDPCSECPGLSAMGWVPVGSLPPVGSRQCLSRCHCHLLYRTAVPGQEPDAPAVPPLIPTVEPLASAPLSFEQQFEASINRGVQLDAVQPADAQWLRDAVSGKISVSRAELERYHDELRGYIAKRESELIQLPEAVVNWPSQPALAIAPQNELRSTLSASELESLQRYKSSEFHAINEYLRTGKVETPRYSTEDRYRDLLDKTITDIDGVMARTPLAAPVRVIRGVAFDKGTQGDLLKEWKATIKAGARIEDSGFMSTTLNQEGVGFGDRGTAFAHGYRFEILVPEGTPGLALDKFAPSGDSASNEAEILLGRGHRLLIHKVIEHGNYSDVVAEIVS